MKKLLSFVLVFAMVFSLAISTVASGDINLYSVKDSWYIDVNEAGTVTVKDNKATYTYSVEAGTNFLGLQRGYTGQLKFVDYAPEIVECTHYFNQWNKITIQERTCTTEGIYLWPCDYCDATYEQIIPGYHFMNDRDYDWSVWKFVNIPATCTEDGLLGYQCCVCGEVAEDAEIIPALGHIEVIDVSAEIVGSAWNGEFGSNARFDLTIELTFNVSRDGDIVEEVIYADAYFRNENFYDLEKTFEFSIGCYDIDVEIVLSAFDKNQFAVFSVASSLIKNPVLVCDA